MRISRLAALAVCTAVSCAVAGTTAATAEPAGGGAPCQPIAAACVDLGSSQGWLMDHGRVTYGPVRLGTGAPGSATPTGMHQVLYKDKDHRSTEFHNASMPYSVFFTHTGTAFHEGNVDEPSNGCVHLGPHSAVRFYDALSPGDQVEVVP